MPTVSPAIAAKDLTKAYGLVELTGLLGAGFLIFGLRIGGSVWQLLLMAVALLVMILPVGLAITSLATTSRQIWTFFNLGGLLLGGMRGAIVPIAELPGWVHVVASLSPGYWAMSGFETATVGYAWGRTIECAGVLFAFGATCTIIATVKFSRQGKPNSW
jgi:ABC-2 type transport system permease protein